MARKKTEPKPTRGQLLGNVTGAELALLCEDHRQVVSKYAETSNYEDTARELGIPVGTVRSRLNRARTFIERNRAAARVDAEAKRLEAV